VKPLRILLVDDHDLFRKGVAALLALKADMEVVGEASDGLEAVQRARETQPDIILMDINMPKCNGLEVIKAIKQEMPHVRVVMLTVSDSDRDLFAAIRNGADGYLLKNLKPDRLFELLEGMRQGESPISDSLTTKVLGELRQHDRTTAATPVERDGLTARDLQVLECVARGATNRAIAETLCITENTVKIHLHNILEKLHVENRIQAAMYAVREGMVSGQPQKH
jgi:two-component system nitrate/nitrite response regulator NarL